MSSRFALSATVEADAVVYLSGYHCTFLCWVNHTMFVLFICSRTGRAGRHGVAYTFISSSQGKYAGELIKALELSSATVPAELTQLWEDYKKEAEAVSLVHISYDIQFIILI